MTLRMIINYNGANYENIRVIIVHDKENSIVNVSDFWTLQEHLWQYYRLRIK